MVRVLVIEDEADSRQLLQMLLEIGGYRVTAVDSEAAAVRALQLGGYDVVLADLMLDRAGVAASWAYIDQIVALARPAPVGLLSGWADIAPQAVARGLAFALRKPCTRKDLFAQLEATLKLKPLAPSTVAMLRDYFDVIASGEYHRFRSLLADEFVYRVPGDDPRFSNEVRGVDEFIAFTADTFKRLAVPRFELGDIRPLPSGALVEYVGSWSEGESRREMPGAVIFEIEQHRIRRADVRVNVDALR